MSTPKGKKSLYLIIGAVFAVVLPFLARIIAGNDYWVLILCTMLIYVIAVSGLDILFGYSGQISLGHASFYVIAAYTTGLLNNYFGIPLIITIPCGAILAALLGAALAYPASRLKFHFLSLATVAFGEITYYFLYTSPGGFTNDYKGINIRTISFLGGNYTKWYFWLLAWAVIFVIAKIFIVNSRTGRAFTAIRENTHAADGMGVNVQKYKILAFAISAFYVGFAGTMYAHLYKYISPETARQKQSVLFLTMMLFGGSGSIAGSIIGVVIIEILLELIRPLQEYQMLLYGILLLIVIIALPGGIVGGFRDMMADRAKKKQPAEGEGGAQNG